MHIPQDLFGLFIHHAFVLCPCGRPWSPSMPGSTHLTATETEMDEKYLNHFRFSWFFSLFLSPHLTISPSPTPLPISLVSHLWRVSNVHCFSIVSMIRNGIWYWFRIWFKWWVNINVALLWTTPHHKVYTVIVVSFFLSVLFWWPLTGDYHCISLAPGLFIIAVIII